MNISEETRTVRMRPAASADGHLAIREVDRQAREAGEAWFREVLDQPM